MWKECQTNCQLADREESWWNRQDDRPDTKKTNLTDKKGHCNKVTEQKISARGYFVNRQRHSVLINHIPTQQTGVGNR